MSERHTRQGDPLRAVSQVRGLDEYEEPDWPVHKDGRGGSKQNLPVLAGPGCWCGKPINHDWPGQPDGAPHPPEGATPAEQLRLARQFRERKEQEQP